MTRTYASFGHAQRRVHYLSAVHGVCTGIGPDADGRYRLLYDPFNSDGDQ